MSQTNSAVPKKGQAVDEQAAAEQKHRETEETLYLTRV
jgi:hypothetical protein